MGSLGFFDLLTIGCLAIAAIVIAIDTAIAQSENLSKRLPRLLKIPYMGYLPLAALLISAAAFTYKQLKPDDIKSPPLASIDSTAFADIKLKRIVNQYFKNQTVLLDGFEYVGCTFENVTFIYEGKAPFLLTEVIFAPQNNTIQFGSPNPVINLAIALQIRLFKWSASAGYRFVTEDEMKSKDPLAAPPPSPAPPK